MTNARAVQPTAFSEDSNQKWVSDRLEHDRDLRLYRNFAFWCAIAVCAILYIAFSIAIILIMTSHVWLQTIIIHKHLLGLLLALLIVPSALLWGIIRAVFKISQQGSAEDAIKTVSSLNPVGQ